MKRNSIRDEVINWNNKYPVDLWWRQKYKVPYGSEQHKSMSFLDMLFDFIESWEIEKFMLEDEIAKKREENQQDEALFGKQDTVIKSSKAEELEMFNNLDISTINDELVNGKIILKE